MLHLSAVNESDSQNLKDLGEIREYAILIFKARISCTLRNYAILLNESKKGMKR